MPLVTLPFPWFCTDERWPRRLVCAPVIPDAPFDSVDGVTHAQRRQRSLLASVIRLDNIGAGFNTDTHQSTGSACTRW